MLGFWLFALLWSRSYAQFDARFRFGNVDEDCIPHISYLNMGSLEVMDLCSAAMAKTMKVKEIIEAGLQEPDQYSPYATFAAYWGVNGGRVQNPPRIYNAYHKIQQHMTRQPFISQLLYCNGTAFDWVSANDGPPAAAENGAFVSKPGRTPKGFPQIYFESSNSPQRGGDLCKDETGKMVQAVDLTLAIKNDNHGKIIIAVFCPAAFERPMQLDRRRQPEGVEIENLISFGSLFQHELTHPLFDTEDYYDEGSAVELANEDTEMALGNADNWMFYSMASLMNSNA